MRKSWRARGGYRAWAVELEITNTSSRRLAVNPFFATLTDSEKYSYTTTLVGCEPLLPARLFFTVPAIAFGRLMAAPTVIYSSPGLTTTFDLGLRNVGNATGAFTLSLTLPITTWIGSLPVSQLTLGAGETFTQTITLETPDGKLGQDYFVSVQSPSGAYTQTVSVAVHMVSQAVHDIYVAAQTISGLYPDETSLYSAVQYLGQAIEEIQAACADSTQLAGPGQAGCATDLRDHVVSGALAVVNHSGPISPYVTADETLQQIAQNLSAETAWPNVQAELLDVRDAVAELQTQLVMVANYNASVWFDPGARVMLNNGSTTFNFNLSNQGRLTSTYSIALTTSDVISAPIAPASFEWTLAPGTSISAPVTITPIELGVYKLQADVTTLNVSGIPVRQAQAGVSVVDAFLKLTNVTAHPAFVEYQSGVTPALTAQVANVANMPIDATARVRVIDAGGAPVFTSTSPIQIGSALVPVDYSVGTINAAQLVTGTYTVAVDLVDVNDQIIPKAVGQGTLAVGQAVHAGSSVSPEIVAPGTVTVTTVITTELDSALLQSIVQNIFRVPGLASLVRVHSVGQEAETP
ncbi:MAG TPA: hypothetical protein VIV60_28870, partial [Polyangiaceae bacterium]